MIVNVYSIYPARLQKDKDFYAVLLIRYYYVVTHKSNVRISLIFLQE